MKKIILILIVIILLVGSANASLIASEGKKQILSKACSSEQGKVGCKAFEIARNPTQAAIGQIEGSAELMEIFSVAKDPSEYGKDKVLNKIMENLQEDNPGLSDAFKFLPKFQEYSAKLDEILGKGNEQEWEPHYDKETGNFGAIKEGEKEPYFEFSPGVEMSLIENNGQITGSVVTNGGGGAIDEIKFTELDGPKTEFTCNAKKRCTTVKADGFEALNLKSGDKVRFIEDPKTHKKELQILKGEFQLKIGDKPPMLIRNARFVIDKNNNIEYAKFESVNTAKYEFEYNKKQYNFNVQSGGTVLFDPMHKKVNIKRTSVKIDEKEINAKIGNADVLFDHEGNIVKIGFLNCKSRCSYDYNKDVNVGSDKDFTVYLDKDIGPKDIRAVSIKDIVTKKKVKLLDIESVGDLTVKYKDKKVEGYKDSRTSLIVDKEGLMPILNIDNGMARFFNGKYGGVIKNVKGKTKIVRIDQNFLLEQEKTSPLFIGEDAIVANGLLRVAKINSYGQKEIRDMFAPSRTIDKNTFQNLKADLYIKQKLDSDKRLLDYYFSKTALVDCTAALKISCFKARDVLKQQIRQLEKIHSDLYKGKSVQEAQEGLKKDPTTKLFIMDPATLGILNNIKTNQGIAWDRFAKEYIDLGPGYEKQAIVARETYYEEMASKIGLNEGLTGKIHRGADTTREYRVSQVHDPIDLSKDFPIAILGSEDLKDLRDKIYGNGKYTLSDGKALTIKDLKELDEEIKRVETLEKQHPELFRQLATNYHSLKKAESPQLKAIRNEAVTWVTTGVIGGPLASRLVKGFKGIKGMVRMPSLRYAKSYAGVGTKLDDIMFKGDIQKIRSSNVVKQEMGDYILAKGGKRNIYVGETLGEKVEKELIDQVEEIWKTYDDKFTLGTISKIQNVKSKDEILALIRKGRMKEAFGETNKFAFKNLPKHKFEDIDDLLMNAEKQIKGLKISAQDKQVYLNRINNIRQNTGLVKKELEIVDIHSPFMGIKPGVYVERHFQKGANKLDFVGGDVKVNDFLGVNKNIAWKQVGSENSYAFIHNANLYRLEGSPQYMKAVLKNVRGASIEGNILKYDGRTFVFKNGKWIKKP